MMLPWNEISELVVSSVTANIEDSGSCNHAPVKYEHLEALYGFDER
jgi:hypothetical protein